ncbi:transcriptional regulator-antiterminator [Streptococcus criceti]|uniref:Uncharacterized protein n=1 Tax=Streptococcus criceti HS-6 TaxID=873449 RepID=G5JQ63_STRCG|nr:PTS sugar transporter subunit IIA [Streptococcus criceti]EHI74656.1 hypothetical protein STRCR_1746 [Streptococcus criceti HS-6]SUN43148.1 transcriptional regulator-antiterminator [Streptococcus criceti]
MSKLDYARLDNILNYLITKHLPVSQDILCKELNISSRTLRHDIKMINDYISDNGAEIELVRRKGYLLNYTDKEKFEYFWHHDDQGTFLFTSAKNRIDFLLRVFLTTDNYVRQDYLLNTFYISQNTLYNDFRSLKQLLAPYHIQIINKSNVGYYISAEESDIRSAILNLIFRDNLYDFISGKNKSVRDICNNIDYKTFSTIFYNFIDGIKLNSTDFFERNSFSAILLTLSRIKYGHQLHTAFKPELKLSPPYQSEFNEFISALNETFQIKLSAYEQSYILFILSENYPNIIERLNLSEDNIQLAHDIVQSLLNHLDQKISDAWIYDNNLKSNLTNHIIRALNVLVIKGNRTNPISQHIKNNFPYAFDLAASEMSRIENIFQLTFSEDEIAYIALYFANAIEKYKNSSRDKIKIAIICGTGKILSSIIQTRLERYFPNLIDSIDNLSLKEFDSTDKSAYDLFVTTIPIKVSDKIYYFDISNFEQNFKDLEKIIRSKRTTLQLFNPLFIKTFPDKITKTDLIKTLANELLQKGYVTESFAQDVFKREEISNTVLDNIVAIPHPINHSVKKSVISVAIIPKGIYWNQSHIKFVFLLAIRPEDIKSLEYIYEKLLDFTTSKALQEDLLRNKDMKTLGKIFNTE